MTKKKTKRKAKKKRIVKTEPGKSLKEARAKQMTGSAFWPWPLRPHQQAAEDARQRGILRFGLFWHRRAGKDVFGMSVAANCMRKRIGGYVHFFPKHVHAKRALWRGVDPRKGARFIDIAFGDIESDRNNQDMMIEAYNGSTWALLGSDNYDSNIIGGNVVGVVFSEWALCDPRAWDFIRPILRENDGWAMFITTFRGRNHAWQMAQKLKDNPDWYIDVRTIEQTSDIEGNRIITDEDVEKDRREGMKESLIQTEYYCNPEATSDGAVYGKQLDRLRQDTPRHVANWNPNKPVYCIWNLDLPVHASYLLAQPGEPPLLLASETINFTTLNEALARSEQQRFPVQTHILPGSQRELIAQFHDLDRHPQVLSNENNLIATTSTTSFLERCHIDAFKCESLLDSLAGYVRRERFDAQAGSLEYTDFPVDSWHTRLVNALETWSIWEYHGAGAKWLSKPNYSTQDRIAKTLL